MSGGQIAALVVVLVIVAAVIIALVVRPALRRKRLRDKFGPEYERTLEETGSRKETEEELAWREKRHAKLELRELTPQARDGYARDWRRVQENFVDAPERAAIDADQLITAVMAERGYPTGDYEQQAADLSVEHADTLSHYRQAHLVIAGHQAGTSTEDLRQAMVQYRTVFEELIGAETGNAGFPDDGRHSATGGQPVTGQDEAKRDDDSYRDRAGLRDTASDDSARARGRTTGDDTRLDGRPRRD